jgi:hypothetical protein
MYLEFASLSGPVKFPALRGTCSRQGRRRLSDGLGEHRLTIGSDAWPFTDAAQRNCTAS